MNKLNKLLLVLMVASSANALTEEEIQAERLAWSKQYLSKEHGIDIDGGVKVIPEKEMKTYKESKVMRDKMHEDIAKFGYINEPNDPNNRLFNLPYIVRRDLRLYTNNVKPINTHAKYTIAEIKMAYKFIGIPSNEVNVIGYAPYLTYIKDKGWAGAMEFFTKEGIGSCIYSENNIKLTHSAANIPKEDVTYDVNGKITTIVIKGTPESKFIYTIDWYDDNFFRRIECANDNYEPSITEGIIEIAKMADKEK